MRRLRRLAQRIAGLWSHGGRERDLAEEFESHFQLHVEDNLRRGMSREEALRDARLKFGSVDSAKESMREASTIMMLETTWQDLKYAARGLARNPAFAATAMLSIALGIGASVAIFTLTDNLLLRPLPYRNPGEIMMVWEKNLRQAGSSRNVINPSNYRDWKSRNHVFDQMAIFTEGRSAFNDGTRVEELGVQYLSAELLPLLGVQPIRGRVFTAAEDLPGAPNVVLISYRLWQSWFGGENVIGKSVQVRSRPATIIGVLPPDFYFLSREIDLWETLGLDPARDYRLKSGRYAMSVGRLKPGVTSDQAQVEMAAIAKQLQTEFPVFDTKWGINVEPLRDALVSEIKTSMLILMGAVGLLLAVACANVANLMLARYTARRREISVRQAIGAGSSRIVRQLLTESLALGIAGGALGVLSARWAVLGLLALAPRDLSRNVAIEVDYRIVVFAVVCSVLTGIVFGLAPGLMASRADLTQGLREDSRSSTGSGRLRSMLVAAEVAMAVMLLAGAGLLFRSLVGLQAVHPGLNPARVLTFNVLLPAGKYRERTQGWEFFKTAQERIQDLPGVESASAVSYLPFDGLGAGTDFAIEGRPPAKPGEGMGAEIYTVLPGYFQTMGIPLKRGRLFTDADNTLDSPYRFVVSEALVRKYLAGEEPLGQKISVSMDNTHPYGEIVGVVGDVKGGALDKDPEPTIYYIHAHLLYSGMKFVVRTHGDPLQLAGPVRTAIHGIDSAQPVAQIRTMESIVRETFARQQFSALLLGGFSMVSLVLAGVGIYGVLAYIVSGRTREIGVRIALGAEPGRILAMVLGSGLRVVLVGAAIGVGGSLALTGLLRSLLFGVKPHDAGTLAAAIALLLAVALVAAYLPARRASRVAPVEALRE